MEPGLNWVSLVWQDGTRYEGLSRNGKMHSHGVLTFPNKDRYEGEFEDGRMHGAGVYVWGSGMIHRGDWLQGVMHGCGTRIWRGPGGDLQAAEGKFCVDEFVGDVMPCSRDEGCDAAVEADMAAFQARSFQLRGRQQPGGRSQQELITSNELNTRTGQQQPPIQPGGLWGRSWRAADATSSSSGSSGSHSTTEGALHDDPRLQSLVQRLVKDRAAESKRQPNRVS